MPGRTIEFDIEEAIREAEEALRPKQEEQIAQSRGNTGKRHVRVVKSESLSKPYEWKFVVVDVDTGEVLDNAQGYGYKTKQKAMAAWNYKTRDRSKDAAKKAKEKLIKDKRLDEAPQRLCGYYGTVKLNASVHRKPHPTKKQYSLFRSRVGRNARFCIPPVSSFLIKC